MASLTQWHEFEQTLGDSEGQRSLVCYSSWGWKSWTWVKWLNNEQPGPRWRRRLPLDLEPQSTLTVTHQHTKRHTQRHHDSFKKMKVLVGLSCLTLYDPMDCSPPGSSSVHGIFQARILEWVAIFFSRGSSSPRDWTWATREVLTIPRSSIKVQQVAQFLEIPTPSLKQLEYSSHLSVYKNLLTYKNWQSHSLGLLLPSEMALTLQTVSKWTHFLPITLSLTEFFLWQVLELH